MFVLVLSRSALFWHVLGRVALLFAGLCLFLIQTWSLHAIPRLLGTVLTHWTHLPTTTTANRHHGVASTRFSYHTRQHGMATGTTVWLSHGSANKHGAESGTYVAIWKPWGQIFLDGPKASRGPFKYHFKLAQPIGT